jgi:hypothetical protein
MGANNSWSTSSFSEAEHNIPSYGNSPTHAGKIKYQKRSFSISSSPSGRLKGVRSSDSIDRTWGWFEDCENQHLNVIEPLHKTLSLPHSIVEPPFYVLESNIETQKLWYSTAGKRPRQPSSERLRFEKLWADNFSSSSVKYSDSSNSHSASSSNTYDHIPESEFNGVVVFTGDSPFTKTVSKAFISSNLSVTIQIPRYRIFKDDDAMYAEFLIVVSLNSPDSLKFGVWRRHSDFCSLVRTMRQDSLRCGNRDLYKNSLLSWECVLQRKRWYKCLNKEYLEIKCFLLERVIHDFLFESSSPSSLFAFLGLC